MQIMNGAQAQVQVIKRQEGEIKATLFRTLTEGKYNNKEVNIAKSKLIKLETQKMDLMFSSLDKVRALLGKDQEFTPDLLNNFHRGQW